MKHLLSAISLFALFAGTAWLTSLAAPPVVDTTYFTWQPPIGNPGVSLCGDGITSFHGNKVNYSPSSVVITVTDVGGFTITGNSTCFECPGFPNGCQNPPTDYGTRWWTDDIAVGVALARPGESLHVIPGNTCPTNLSTQEAQGHLVWYSEIHYPLEDQWIAVDEDDIPSWTWGAGGPTGVNAPESGTFTITDPAVLAKFSTNSGGVKKWEMEISNGHRYDLDWTGCTHQYFLDSWTDNIKVQVDILP